MKTSHMEDDFEFVNVSSEVSRKKRRSKHDFNCGEKQNNLVEGCRDIEEFSNWPVWIPKCMLFDDKVQTLRKLLAPG